MLASEIFLNNNEPHLEQSQPLKTIEIEREIKRHK